METPRPVSSPVEFPKDVEHLTRLVQELLATLQAERRHNQQLQHRLDQLLRRLYGPRAERFDPQQPSLFPELQEPAAPPDDSAPPSAAAEPAEDTPRCQRRGRGRRLPAHLRREYIDHTLTEAERPCPCCGKLRPCIGTRLSERLEYEPAVLYVVAHVEHAY